MAIRTTTTASGRYGSLASYQPVVVKTIGRINVEAAARAELASYAVKGQAMAVQDPHIVAARDLISDAGGRTGFDVAVASTSGSVPSALQKSLRGYLARYGEPGSAQGFDVGQALMFGLAKQGIVDKAMALDGDPGVAAGQLVTNGLNDSGLPEDQKASAMSAIASDAAARSGAARTLGDISAKQQMSFWEKVKDFFGF